MMLKPISGRVRETKPSASISTVKSKCCCRNAAEAAGSGTLREMAAFVTFTVSPFSGLSLYRTTSHREVSGKAPTADIVVRGWHGEWGGVNGLGLAGGLGLGAERAGDFSRLLVGGFLFGKGLGQQVGNFRFAQAAGEVAKV